MTLSSSAQNSIDQYPQAKVINNQPVVLITPLQLKFVNRTLVTVGHLSSVNSGLSDINKSLTVEVGFLNARIDNLNKQIDSQDVVIESYVKLGREKTQQHNQEIKNLKKKTRKTGVIAGLAGVTVGLILAVLISL